MALNPGTRLGVYEVTVNICEGRMGDVYQACSTKLVRDVGPKASIKLDDESRQKHVVRPASGRIRRLSSASHATRRWSAAGG